MPGIGPRIWNPPQRMHTAELPMTVINMTVNDAVALNGTTVPYQSYTGNIAVRMVGRANTATRPLTITVKWGAKTFIQKALFVESGAGGSFAGIWTLAGEASGTANIVITTNNAAGTTAIRIGEIGGAPVQVYAGAVAGYNFTRAMAPGNAILTVGGCADETADPFSSTDLSAQWSARIPAKINLPNRHNGLAAHFGITYDVAGDGIYSIAPKNPIAGVIAGLELKLTGATG